MTNPDASTPFDLGTSTINVTEGVTIKGSSDQAQIVNGGTAGGLLAPAFKLDAPAKDLKLENLFLTNPKTAAIWIRRTRDVELKSIKLRWDTGQNMVSSANNLYGIFGGSSTQVPFEVTGNVSIEDIDIDFEQTADPTDPYAGGRSVLNPDLIANGGGWSGSGRNANSWATFGILLRNTGTGFYNVRRNKVVNFSSRGLQGFDCIGTVSFDENTVISPYGVHVNGNSFGVSGIETMNLSTNFPELQVSHGNYHVDKNNVVLPQVLAAGCTYGCFTPFRPESLSYTRNKFIYDGGDARFGMFGFGQLLGNIAHNKIIGTGIFGLFQGGLSFAIGERNAFGNNRLERFVPSIADLLFTGGTQDNIAYAGGTKLEIVSDSGVNNKIVGFNVGHNEVTQEIQDLLDEIDTTFPSSYDGYANVD